MADRPFQRRDAALRLTRRSPARRLEVRLNAQHIRLGYVSVTPRRRPCRAAGQARTIWTHESRCSPMKMDLQVQTLTAKGEATRRRIIEGAAAEIRDRGVAATTLDDIREHTQTSKSQLFHYFPG